MAVFRIYFAAVPILLLLQVSTGFSQVSSGAIVGTIADASNALIPGVQIVVINSGTNQIREVVSNETGNYRVEPLQPGLYSVSAELPGFRKEIRGNIQVYVDSRVRVDFRLEVGAVSEAIEVLGSAPIVQTDDSQVGQVIEQRKIADLPLNGRNFSQLAYLTPGAYAPRPSSHLSFRGGFVATGMEEKTNQYLLDGVNNNGAMTMEIAYFPNVDAIAEFKVQSQNYGAQYGRYAGVQVDAVTKSGTNELHGSVFGFTRNDNLDARNFFDPWPLDRKPEFKRHQFGGVLGGPILRDKLFFFVGFQGQRALLKQTTQPTVPFPAYWAGDLSRLNKVIRDPLTGQAFPGGQIPRDRISPIALNFRPLFPAAVRDTFVNNAQAVIPIQENFVQPNVKVNYNLAERHQISGSYNIFHSPQNLEWNFANRPDIPGFSMDGPIKNQSLSVQWVWSASSNIVNEFRTGISRINRDRRAELRDRNYALQVGIPGTAGDITELAWGYPRVDITGYSWIGSTNVQPDRIDGNIVASDTISIQKGNHAIKLGGDIFRQYARYFQWGNNAGRFDFTGAATGDPFADFLLGLPNVTQRTVPLGALASYPRRWSTNWFLQDDWKVRRDFTLNVGLRYELTFPLDELYGRLMSFDPSIGNGRGGLRIKANGSNADGSDHRYRDAIATFKSFYPGLLFDYAEQFYKTDKNNFAPRIGMAWTPGGMTSTVVRAGYGIFFTLDDLCFCAQYTGVPFSLAERFTSASRPTFQNPWPGRGLAGTIVGNGVDSNLVSAYYGHWNLGIQHELPGGVALDISYTGKKGTKLDTSRDINQPIKGVRPYPLFGPITYLEPRGSSSYHGLQTRVERRSSSGSTFLVSYMWGKLLDDISAGASVQDAYNLRVERGLGQEDMRHRLTTSFVLPLPFGRGQRYFNSMPGVADALFSQWEISGIYRANSGSPYTPTISRDISGSGRPGNDRPNLVGDPKSQNPHPVTGWWNRAAFAMPAQGTFGNAGKGVLIGPGYSAADLSLMKRFVLSEDRVLQFRWENFNVFNHANFWDPATRFDTPAFGRIGFSHTNRQMQFGLKFLF